MPKMLGLHDDPERPLLLLEDLSAAHWPPPWEPGEVERLLETLNRVASIRPLPRDLRSLEDDRPRLAGWAQIARDPDPFLALGLCSADWLAQALPILLRAQDAAVLAGDELVHNDVRSDNVCLLPDRVVLVDWNEPRRGNADFDTAFLAPSVRLEGGPLPEEIATDGPLTALVSGYFGANAGLPLIPDAPGVRKIQLRQLRIALPWVARALGLPPPDLPWARHAMQRVEDAYAGGRIEQKAWHEQIEEITADAYLASDDPRAQSGKSGDEEDWRWSRELVLDAMPNGGTLLDVGCANGYLMESLHRWAMERAIGLEPYGLDISWRLAALARRRLPHWSGRIWVGNVMQWTPPRRFDVVHTGIDYVPRDRQRYLLDRMLRELVVPGGRVVLRAARVDPNEPDIATQVRALGFDIGGVLERMHPRSGAMRRTVWLAG